MNEISVRQIATFGYAERSQAALSSVLPTVSSERLRYASWLLPTDADRAGRYVSYLVGL